MDEKQKKTLLIITIIILFVILIVRTKVGEWRDAEKDKYIRALESMQNQREIDKMTLQHSMELESAAQEAFLRELTK